MASNELISPEIILLKKLEEVDNSLSPALWQQMCSDVDMADSLEYADTTMLPTIRHRKRMFLRDFVEKAISLPLKIIPNVQQETADQLYRLHLFCCQKVIHSPEVRHNPFRLGFNALREMKTALMGMMISYRLIDPSCPYSWTHNFFESNIITDKEADGRTIVIFKNIPPHIIPMAITEEMVTDWLIYRAYDNNGIRTLMDYKNNLLTLPDYQRGGAPENEFSRFERKMQEQRNREEKHKNQELDLEFRKTLVKSVAEQTAERLLGMGLSDLEILNRAYHGDLNTLIDMNPLPRQKSTHTSNLPQQTAFNQALAPNNNPYLGNNNKDSTRLSHRKSNNVPNHDNRYSTDRELEYIHETSEYGISATSANNNRTSSDRGKPVPSLNYNGSSSSAGHNTYKTNTAIKNKTEKDPDPSLIDEVIARFLDE